MDDISGWSITKGKFKESYTSHQNVRVIGGLVKMVIHTFCVALVTLMVNVSGLPHSNTRGMFMKFMALR